MYIIKQTHILMFLCINAHKIMDPLGLSLKVLRWYILWSCSFCKAFWTFLKNMQKTSHRRDFREYFKPRTYVSP